MGKAFFAHLCTKFAEVRTVAWLEQIALRDAEANQDAEALLLTQS